MSEIRIEHLGIVFRLFGDRRETIQAANLLTRQEGRQHNAKPVRGESGHIVVSADKKSMYDKAGLLPADAMEMLRNRGAYLEWASDCDSSIRLSPAQRRVLATLVQIEAAETVGGAIHARSKRICNIDTMIVLVRHGLVEKPSRWVWQITQAGRDWCLAHPSQE